MRPLTAEELTKRTVALHAKLVAEGHDPIETLWEIVVCDGCALKHNLLDGFPVGWWTTGDLSTGFRDLCAGCSP